MSGDRGELIELFGAAVAGANPESLATTAIKGISLERRQRVWVFAFGKAAVGMATAAVGELQRGLAEVTGGLAVAPECADAIGGTIPVLAGDHPVPGPRSFEAAARLQQVITQKRGTDLGIVLLSGGTSSLLGAPLRGMSEAELSALSELLLGCGLDILQVNAIRRRFCLWAGGRLALALAPARTCCFALSDVPGDDLAAIGSGPCVPDPTRAQDVIDLLRQAKLYDAIPAGFRRFLQDTTRGMVPETPKVTHPAFAHVTATVVGNNVTALTAAATASRNAGYATVVSREPLAGDAAVAGARLADALVAARERATSRAPLCFLWGGETTMQLGRDAPRGGRCQAMALAAARQLAQAGDRATGITLLVAGTDGRDGTTDAAGAIVDRTTWSAIAAAGADPAVALGAHDAHAALRSAGALFAPGPTGTNVMDVAIGIVRRDAVA